MYLLLLKHIAAKSLELCPTLSDPIDDIPPGSPIPGILQARTLEWVAISFSNAWKWKVKVKSLCRVWLLATPWTAAYQAPLSMGFSRQEYCSGEPLPSPWNTGHSKYVCSIEIVIPEIEDQLFSPFKWLKAFTMSPEYQYSQVLFYPQNSESQTKTNKNKLFVKSKINHFKLCQRGKTKSLSV